MQFLKKVKTNIKLVTTEKERNYLVSEPNNHSTKFFKENFIAVEMEKNIYIYMNKPVYLGLSILELSKIVMYLKGIKTSRVLNFAIRKILHFASI